MINSIDLCTSIRAQFINNIKKIEPVSTMQLHKTIRLRVKTNKSIDMIIAIQSNKTMRQLAHRVLNCYHELANQHTNTNLKRRDLTVSALKIDNYYVAKSEVIENLLRNDDEIQCMFAKAKPRFPNQPNAYEKTLKLIKQQNNTLSDSVDSLKKDQLQKLQKQRMKSKRQRKRQKKLQKLKQQLEQKARGSQYLVIQNKNKNNQQNFIQQKQSQIKNQINNKQKDILRTDLHKLPNKEQMLSKNPIQREQQMINQQHSQQDIKNNSDALPNVSFCSTISNYKVHNSQNEKFNTNNSSVQKQKKPLRDSSPQKKQYRQYNLSPINRQKQVNKKKNKINSILDILSRATEQKQKKLRKKEKKIEKLQQGQNNKSSQKQYNNQLLGNNLKITKVQKQSTPTHKIASPKVTFHISPINSPQMFSLNSPKRKASNPSIQKFEKIQLQANVDNRQNKKEGQKQKKLATVEVKPIQVKNQAKKQNSISTVPKIIVEQQSEGQSAHLEKNTRQDMGGGRQLQQATNSKLAALDAKLSKYKLQFFNDSEQD